jgi:hypothetical protein
MSPLILMAGHPTVPFAPVSHFLAYRGGAICVVGLCELFALALDPIRELANLNTMTHISTAEY